MMMMMMMVILTDYVDFGQSEGVILLCITVEPRLSGLVGTSVNSPDNRVSG